MCNYTKLGDQVGLDSKTANDDYHLMYYRDADKFAVDVVIENTVGQIIGVEVKAAASIKESDLRGLEKIGWSCRRSI